MDNNLDSMQKEFVKSVEDKEIFIKAQNNTISMLTKKVNELEKENNLLKRQIKDLKDNNSFEDKLKVNTQRGSDDEIICLTQLKLLREIAEERELTMEETKKTEIFIKALNSLKQEQNKKPEGATDLSNDNLLSLLDNDDMKESLNG